MSVRGFTMIEMVTTVAIVSLLATVAMPVAEMAVKRTKEQELRQALREVRAAIDAYNRAVEEGRIARTLTRTGYPASLHVLVEGVEDQSDPRREKIYFLRRIPRDPFNPDPTLGAEESWGLRSYASPSEDPQPGDDVFDVYSKAEGIGLNGIVYSEW